MPLNLLKVYNQLLELSHLAEAARQKSLYGIFKRDIEENTSFKFRTKKINPTKGEIPAMQILFQHLTTAVIDERTKKREYEPQRSERLHWVRFHIDEKKPDVTIFSVEDNSEIRTYIYDADEQYVIILEPYRNKAEYYLITAYKVQGRNTRKIENKYKRRTWERVF